MPSIHPSYTWYLNEQDQFDVDLEHLRLFNEAHQRTLRQLVNQTLATKIEAKKSGFAKFVRKIEGSS